MDLSLFLAVLWRSKRLLLVGLLLGAVLAVLAYGKPGFTGGKPTLTPRGAEVWQSESQLLIAQAGFPYGETTTPSASLSALSPVYANVGNGDVVQAEIKQQFGKLGTVKASESIDAAAASNLPFVTFLASAPTEQDAAKLAAGAAVIFRSYVARQQASAAIPRGRRVQLSIVESATKPKLTEGHKLSIPILVFLAVLMGVVSVVFLKENLRKSRAAARLELAPSEELASFEEPEQAPRHGEGSRAHPGYASAIGAREQSRI
jgi:hypothetical protein